MSMFVCLCVGLWSTLCRIHLSARNSRGFGPNATFTVETLDIGEYCYVSYCEGNVVGSHCL